MIYYLVLLSTSGIYLRQSRKQYAQPTESAPLLATAEPGLLATSKQIRNEASAIYYTYNDCFITLGTTTVDDLVQWLQDFTLECGRLPFRKIHFFGPFRTRGRPHRRTYCVLKHLPEATPRMILPHGAL